MSSNPIPALISYEEIVSHLIATLENKSRNIKKRISKIEKFKDKPLADLNLDQKRSLGGLEILNEMDNYLISFAAEYRKYETNVAKIVAKNKSREIKQRLREDQLLSLSSIKLISVLNILKKFLHRIDSKLLSTKVECFKINSPLSDIKQEEISNQAESHDTIYFTREDLYLFLESHINAIQNSDDLKWEMPNLCEKLTSYGDDSTDFYNFVEGYIIEVNRRLNKVQDSIINEANGTITADECTKTAQHELELLCALLSSELFPTSIEKFSELALSWKNKIESEIRHKAYLKSLEEIEQARIKAAQEQQRLEEERAIREAQELANRIFVPKAVSLLNKQQEPLLGLSFETSTASSSISGCSVPSKLTSSISQPLSFEKFIQNLQSDFHFVDEQLASSQQNKMDNRSLVCGGQVDLYNDNISGSTLNHIHHIENTCSNSLITTNGKISSDHMIENDSEHHQHVIDNSKFDWASANDSSASFESKHYTHDNNTTASINGASIGLNEDVMSRSSGDVFSKASESQFLLSSSGTVATSAAINNSGIRYRNHNGACDQPGDNNVRYGPTGRSQSYRQPQQQRGNSTSNFAYYGNTGGAVGYPRNNHYQQQQHHKQNSFDDESGQQQHQGRNYGRPTNDISNTRESQIFSNNANRGAKFNRPTRSFNQPMQNMNSNKSASMNVVQQEAHHGEESRVY